MECCYVRDDDFAEWVEAGWLRPCEDLLAADPDTSATTARISSPYNLSSMTYGGKRYGLPYYNRLQHLDLQRTHARGGGVRRPGPHAGRVD